MTAHQADVGRDPSIGRSRSSLDDAELNVLAGATVLRFGCCDRHYPRQPPRIQRYGPSLTMDMDTRRTTSRSTSVERCAPRALAAAAGISLLVLVTGAALSPADGASAVPHVDPTTSWTVYHGNPLGTGVDPSGVTFSPPNLAWTSPVLDGQLYGEPLEAAGRVYVATENDTIYALAANTGAILWSSHVGTPVPSGDVPSAGPSGDLPCSNINPTVGITGTPVIDAGRGEIFAVADELSGGSPSHVLVGLNMYTGSSMMEQTVNPPGSIPANNLQRTGLNISDGNVVFGYGGNVADCGTYSGWIVSVPEGGGSVGYYQTTPDFTKGAVWMGVRRPRSMRREHLGGHRQRIRVDPIRRQRLGDRALARVGAGAVVRPQQLVQPK